MALSRNFWKESAELRHYKCPRFHLTFGGSRWLTVMTFAIIFELIGKSLCVEPFLASGVIVEYYFDPLVSKS